MRNTLLTRSQHDTHDAEEDFRTLNGRSAAAPDGSDRDGDVGTRRAGPRSDDDFSDCPGAGRDGDGDGDGDHDSCAASLDDAEKQLQEVRS